ncbi:MAG: C39 family peptidase, partial [Anaerolineales bacterium]
MGKLKALLLLFLLSGIAVPARAQGSALPDQAYISGVIGHPQTYTLSCESRSAVDWAAYWGVDIGETRFLERLPRSDNPNQGFVGNPNDIWGYVPPASYGVHAKPVARLLRDYGLDAHAGNGLSWDELRSEIAAGRPVIVWVIGSIWRGMPREYETRSGEVVRVANNEHTMILIGYDENSVQLVDALTGYTLTHSIENFLTSWSVLGNMAVLGAGSGEKQGSGDQETSASQDTYTVQRGDTLSKLGTRWDIDWQDLAAWNQINYPYLIFPGQTLILRGDEDQANSGANSSAKTYT